jgi:archaemetzincin
VVSDPGSGFTMHDLCNTESGFGFVFGEAQVSDAMTVMAMMTVMIIMTALTFGEAQLDKSVGIFSFARYGAPAATPDFLRRCCMVLTHEVTHLFGVKHCVYAQCLMNGSNHIDEASSEQPQPH